MRSRSALLIPLLRVCCAAVPVGIRPGVSAECRNSLQALLLGSIAGFVLIGSCSLRAQQCDAGVTFSGPIQIGQGGTYSGNWQSTDPSVPAVLIYTSDPVTIINSRLKGPGDLILSGTGSKLTVQQSCFVGTNPNVTGLGKGSPIHTYKAASVQVENCDFESGGYQGIWVQEYTGDYTLDNTITILNNRIHNVDGRLSDGNGGWLETIASQNAAQYSHGINLSNVLGVPGIEIAWNQIITEAYNGGVGDSINIYNGSGTAGSPAQIHDNYIQGGYDSVPTNGSNLPYYGSGFTTDGSYTTDPSQATAYLKIHDMQAVNVSNAGISIAVGHDLEMYNNRVISTGQLADGTNISTTFSVGMPYWNYINDPPGVFGNNSVHDNLSGLRRQRNGSWERFDYWFALPPTIAYNNVDFSPNDPSHPTPADEANELSLWNQKLIANGVMIGSPMVKPLISYLSPASQTQGAPSFLLTVNGTGFVSGAVVLWNGAPLSTTFVGDGILTASVPAGLVASPGMAAVTVLNPGNGTSIGVAFQILPPLQFVPVTPCRLVDTRPENGGIGPITGGTYDTFNLPQAAQQSKGCPMLDLSSAAAYSLNLTVVPSGPLGYVTVWPTGEDQPVVSTENSLDGRVKANAAIVPAGNQGAVSIFASNTTDVVLDIDGYFTPVSGSTLAFYPLTPCRVADTRNPPGDLGGPYLSGGVARDLPILEASSCNIPSSAQAYSLNFTAVPHVPLGYLTVWPAGQTQPVVSTLNALTTTTTANAAIVPAGTLGDIEVFASNDSDLVIDINGYFAPPGPGGLSLYAVVPCRVLDTRNGNGQFVGTIVVDAVDSVCEPSSQAQAYVFNATVVPPGPLGYLTLWPDGGQQPVVSTLNAVDAAITSNMAIVPANNGKIDAFASNLTQLVMDISAYFAPIPPLSITTTSLPSGTLDYNYSTTLGATGGITPYAWSVASGNLPPGLNLDSNSGVISGMPTVLGDYPFTVQVADSQSPPATAAAPLSISVSATITQLTIVTTSLPSGTQNTAYSAMLAATGGITPYAWSITAGNLPAGLSLNSSTGAITGTPTGAGTAKFTVQVADSESPAATASAQLGITIQPAVPLSITTTSLPTGVGGTPYNASVTAIGGVTPYTWSITAGKFPSGLMLNSSTGAITGTPTVVGTSNFTVQVSDSETPPVMVTAQLNITINSGGGGDPGVLQGNYAFFLNGFNFELGQWTLAGSFISDGKGNITSGVLDGNSVAGQPFNTTITGTYSIASSGLNTFTIQSESYGPVTFAFVLSSSGNGRIIEYDDTTGQGNRGR